MRNHVDALQRNSDEAGSCLKMDCANGGVDKTRGIHKQLVGRCGHTNGHKPRAEAGFDTQLFVRRVLGGQSLTGTGAFGRGEPRFGVQIHGKS